MLREIGFDRTGLRKVEVPMNSWKTDDKYNEIGALNQRNNIQAVAPLSYAVLCEGLGWSRTEVDVLIRAVKRDIANTHFHGYTSM